LLFVVSLASTVIFVRFSKLKIITAMLIIAIVSLIFMTVSQSIWHLALFDFLRAIAVSLIWIALSLFIRDFSKSSEIGSIE
jgi:chromate transport protein ChrA